MPIKGGVSFPMVIAVSIIIIAIVIALIYIFVWNTKVKLELAFEDLVGSIGNFGCSLLGSVKGSVCPT